MWPNGNWFFTRAAEMLTPMDACGEHTKIITLKRKVKKLKLKIVLFRVYVYTYMYVGEIKK